MMLCMRQGGLSNKMTARGCKHGRQAGIDGRLDACARLSGGT
jgi:hypothetical protein